ncbi:PHA-granule associated protein 4 (plasmid) [Ralstonia solanacearum]|nr:PHA-granule associated protein 4 [Ralstonia solanacearum]
MPLRPVRNDQVATVSVRASTREEALRLVGAEGVAVVELDYESGWQDAVELGRLGRAVGVRVEFRGHESIAVKSPAALVAGLARAKATFRQRNLYCQFDLDRLPTGELEQLEAKAAKLGDYILSGHLLREVDAAWFE